MHPYARAFYKSRAWERCRASYIANRRGIDGGLCEVCHREPGYIVHHRMAITPENINDPDITLCWDNLQYVCKACHDKIHHYCGRAKGGCRYVFDEDGNPVPMPGAAAEDG